MDSKIFKSIKNLIVKYRIISITKFLTLRFFDNNEKIIIGATKIVCGIFLKNVHEVLGGRWNIEKNIK